METTATADAAFLQSLSQSPPAIGHVDAAGRRWHFRGLTELERATLLEAWQYDDDGDLIMHRRVQLRARYAQLTLCTPGGSPLFGPFSDEIPDTLLGLPANVLTPVCDAILAFHSTPTLADTEKNSDATESDS